MDIKIRKLFGDEYYFTTEAPKDVDIYEGAVIDWLDIGEGSVTITTVKECRVEVRPGSIGIYPKEEK